MTVEFIDLRPEGEREYRVLVTGSRNWHFSSAMRPALEDLARSAKKYGWSVILIHGDAAGADRMADRIGQELGFSVRRFPAKWSLFGRAAGPMRNDQMLKEGRPVVVMAFHEDIGTSKGTAHMIKRAQEEGIPVFFTDHLGNRRRL